MTKIKLKIDSMHCTSCALNIDFDLEDLPGVISATTSYSKSESVVEFDDTKISVIDILSRIKSKGYSASPLPRSS